MIKDLIVKLMEQANSEADSRLAFSRFHLPHSGVPKQVRGFRRAAPRRPHDFYRAFPRQPDAAESLVQDVFVLQSFDEFPQFRALKFGSWRDERVRRHRQDEADEEVSSTERHDFWFSSLGWSR